MVEPLSGREQRNADPLPCLEQREAALLADLRRETNGAVAASMSERGLSYGLNYGVSITDIRRICRGYAPDDELANYIYPKDIRELRLSAYLVADSAGLTPDTFDFWAAGLTTGEAASNGALSLFSKSPYAGRLIACWLGNGREPLLNYSALLTAAANIMHTGGVIDWDWEQVLELIFDRVRESAGNPFLADGIAALIPRLLTVPGVKKALLKEFIRRIWSVDPPLGKHLETEVGWSLA